MNQSLLTTEARSTTRGVTWRRASARVLTGIAGAFQRLGKLRAAERLLTAAFSGLGRGPSLRAERLTILNRLGVVLKTAGRYDAAESRYTEVLSTLISLVAPPLYLLAVTRHNLAGLAYARGDYQHAEAQIRHALALRQRAGASLADRAADEGVLGAVLAAQGRDDEARDVLNYVLTTMEHAHGVNHYEVAVVLQNLAALNQRSDPDHAQRLYQRSLAIKRRQLGPHHPEIGVLLNNLATLNRQQGRKEIALDLYAEARTILRRGYGTSHPATRLCEENLRRVGHVAMKVRSENQPGG